MGTATIDLRTLAAIADFASREKTQYYIGGVLLEIEPRSVTYVATDGHRLAARRDALSEADQPHTLIGHFLIPLAPCKTLRPRKRESGDAVLSGSGERLTVSVRDVERASFAPIDGCFPAWRRLVPKKLSGKTAQFNGAYLGSFEKLGKALEIGWAIVAHNGGDGALVTFLHDSDVIGVVMPVRRAQPSLAPPEWAVAA